IEGQVAAVYDNAAIRELLSDKNSMNVEVACFMKHKSGLELKTLCDLVIGDAVIDWKSTCMRNPYSFLRDAVKRGYDYQAAHTCLVTGKSRFLFGSVSDAFPYEANLWEVPAR